MIKEISRHEGAEVIKAAKAHPATGALLEVHWGLCLANPKMPFRFFLAGENTVVKLTKSEALLCGEVENSDEMEDFLRLCGISTLISGGWKPKLWRKAKEHSIMLREPGPYVNSRSLPCSYKLCDTPEAGAVLRLIEAEKPMGAAELRDSFYSDICSRRNHGLLKLWTCEKAGQPVATAGIYALTDSEGYVACVETLKEERGRGLASFLLGHICENYGKISLSLACEEKMTDFYKGFGFENSEKKWLVFEKQGD